MNRFDNKIKRKRNDILIINNISTAMVTNEISTICIRFGALCTSKTPRCRTCYIIMFNAIRKLNCNNKNIYKRKITCMRYYFPFISYMYLHRHHIFVTYKIPEKFEENLHMKINFDCHQYQFLFSNICLRRMLTC